MNYLILSIVLILSLGACKRRPGQVPTHGDIQWNNGAITASSSSTISPEIVQETITDNEPQQPKRSITPPAEKREEVPTSGKVENLDQPNDFNEIIPGSKPLKRAQIRKEIPSALNNALWMTGVGLGGMLLMLLLFSWFDTSVLFVLFGILFLVGIISLLMFKLNNKPKIQK